MRSSRFPRPPRFTPNNRTIPAWAHGELCRIPSPRERRMDEPTGSIVALTAAGVTVLADATGPGLPVIAYWGPALPRLDAFQAVELLRATDLVQGTNNIAARPRVSPLPSHAAGWTGRPGLSGSASGIG